MKILHEMPTSGQFVAVWEHAGNACSEMLKWDAGELFIYNNVDDNWFVDNVDFFDFFNGDKEFIFYVA